MMSWSSASCSNRSIRRLDAQPGSDSVSNAKVGVRRNSLGLKSSRQRRRAITWICELLLLPTECDRCAGNRDQGPPEKNHSCRQGELVRRPEALAQAVRQSRSRQQAE